MRPPYTEQSACSNGRWAVGSLAHTTTSRPPAPGSAAQRRTAPLTDGVHKGARPPWGLYSQVIEHPLKIHFKIEMLSLEL